MAYAGLDPSVYQSGKFNASHTQMSKRGSKLLSYALINAAWQLTLNNKTFKDYYELKSEKAESHRKGKLVRVIHKIMIDNVEFNLA